MAISVKKAKKPKSKGQKLQLSDFLGTVPSVSQVNITKNISWGDECEQEDIVSIALPTAPRSTRVLDDALIPQEPPFLAYMTNLPYDLNEEDLQQYFEEQLECEVVSVRLPRDDKDSGRMRGFGYVEFKEREDLIAAVSLPDPQIRNRRIRIDISNENDQKRGNSRRGYDNFGSSSENRDTNWRRDDGARGQEDDRESGRRGGYNYGNRDRERQRDQGADPDNSNWRSGDRPKPESPPPSRRNFQDRGEGGAGGERYGRDRFGGRRNNGYEERPRRDEPVLEEERPRLQLKPRTLPLPELEMKPDDDVKPREPLADEQQSQPRPKPVPVPAASIFGSAKPVDTAAKDRLIEERMERERQEKIKAEEQEREEKEKESEEKENDASEKPDEKVPDDGDNGAITTTDDADEPAAAPAPATAAPVHSEPISWRKRDDDDAVEPSRTQSPPRRRFSPNRRPRRNDDQDRKSFRDNRDNRDRGDNRDHRDHRDHRDNRDNRDNRRGDHNNRDRRDYNRDNRNRNDNYRNQNRDNNNRGPPQREDKEIKRREDDPKDVEIRMPKFKEPTKPNLTTANPYDYLNDEVSE